MKFEIKAHSYKRIDTPFDRDRLHCNIVVVEATRLPFALQEWREVNLRSVNLKSGAAKAMLDTIAEEPDQFFFRNRGIVIMAEAVHFDPKSEIVTVNFTDKKIHGILDGGHTLGVIFQALKSTEEPRKPIYVRLEILTGFKELDQVVDVVEGRNTSTAVTLESFQNMSGRYSDIIDSLKGAAYENKIAYQQFQMYEDERRPVPIREILSYLICFFAEEFGDDFHPHRVYSSKQFVLQYFERHADRIARFTHLLPDILTLRDAIYRDLPGAYNVYGRFGRVDGVQNLSRAGELTPLHFLGGDSPYRIPNSYILPILAAHRSLMRMDRGFKCRWVDNCKPVEVWEVTKDRLAQKLHSQIRSPDFEGPNRYCKNSANWDVMYSAFQMAVFANSR